MAERLQGPDEDAEGGKMPLMDHLVELRRRLVISIGAFVVCFFLGYAIAEPIYQFLVEPLAHLLEGQQGRRMIYTALHEAFFTYVKVGFFFAACISFPIVSIQIWLFIAPGLYKHERKALMPFLAATPFLFLLGASMVYYIVIPLAWQFFLGFESPGKDGNLAIVLEPKVGEYLSLVMRSARCCWRFRSSCSTRSRSSAPVSSKRSGRMMRPLMTSPIPIRSRVAAAHPPVPQVTRKPVPSQMREALDRWEAARV